MHVRNLYSIPSHCTISDATYSIIIKTALRFLQTLGAAHCITYAVSCLCVSWGSHIPTGPNASICLKIKLATWLISVYFPQSRHDIPQIPNLKFPIHLRTSAHTLKLISQLASLVRYSSSPPKPARKRRQLMRRSTRLCTLVRRRASRALASTLTSR